MDKKEWNNETGVVEIILWWELVRQMEYIHFEKLRVEKRDLKQASCTYQQIRIQLFLVACRISSLQGVDLEDLH